MLHNCIIRLGWALLLSIILSWIGYKAIVFSSGKFVSAVRHNEHLFRNNNRAYNILLLGTSRMKNHLNPAIIDSITGLRSFNAALGGCNAIEANMILKAYLLHHKPPQYLFVSADVIFICTDKFLTQPAAYLTFDDIAPIKEMLGKCGMPLWLYDAVPFLKITEMEDNNRVSPLYTIKSWIKPMRMDNSDSSGFINTTTKTLKGDKPKATTSSKVDSNSITALDEIIAQCKQNNIQLLFIHAPEFKHYYTGRIANLDEIMNVYHERCNANNIVFLHYDSLDFCSKPQYFKDNGHLNAAGSTLYSHIFAQDILKKDIIHRP